MCSIIYTATGKWIGNLIFKRHEIEKTNNAKDQIIAFHVPKFCIFESRRALTYFDTVVTYIYFSYPTSVFGKAVNEIRNLLDSIFLLEFL